MNWLGHGNCLHQIAFHKLLRILSGMKSLVPTLQSLTKRIRAVVLFSINNSNLLKQRMSAVKSSEWCGVMAEFIRSQFRRDPGGL